MYSLESICSCTRMCMAKALMCEVSYIDHALIYAWLKPCVPKMYAWLMCEVNYFDHAPLGEQITLLAAVWVGQVVAFRDLSCKEYFWSMGSSVFLAVGGPLLVCASLLWQEDSLDVRWNIYLGNGITPARSLFSSSSFLMASWRWQGLILSLPVNLRISAARYSIIAPR